MKTTKQHKVWIILLLILLPTFLLNGQILFKKKISIDDGLAYSQVLCGIVDDEGYFWFGTSSGLSRWDGNNFQNFYISNGLISNHIKEILWHKTFGLIIATQNGVNFLKNGEIITPENYPQKLFTRINYLLSYKNKLLIATNNYGLWEYDGKVFNQILIDGDENLSIYTLFTNNKDEILVGTENGLFTFKNNTLSKNNKYIFPKKVTITSLNQEETGRLIVGTIANGIYIFSKKEVTNINKYNGLPTNRINNITKGAGTLWYIATDEGAAVLDKNQIVKYYNTNSGLETDFIWNILKYKDYYYFLTDGSGFYQYAPDRFEYYNTSSGLPNNTVWNFEELNDGSICLTTDNGIAIISEKGIQNLRTNKEVRDDIIDVFESANGTLFFGTNNNGVAIYDNNVFSFINQSNGLTSSAVWSITDDKNGYLYFSTFNGGICVYKNGSIIDTIDINDGLPNNNILTSFTSEDGTLYFSVDGEGVFTYKDKEIKPFCTKLSAWSETLIPLPTKVNIAKVILKLI
ncbi:MAG: hypothetical protein L3J41_00680 [Melioribacteraceae bacterium]|nr:hypothetical protein [Melioribacteraceae bacterium]